MKNSKIPLLPLFIADALIFAFVFACALPSLSNGLPMSGAQTFTCCAAVLLGMFLMLVPYYLEYKKDIAKKYEHTEEARKNFEIIFDELAALRLALADLVERVENDELKYDSFPAAEKNIIDLKSDIKNLVASLAETRDKTEEAIANAETSRRNVKQTLEEIGADIAVLKESLSAINESTSEEIDSIRATINNLNTDEDKIEEEPTQKPVGKVEVGHLLRRALQNANDTKSSVEKFIALNNKEEEQTDIAEVTTESSENDESDFFEPADSPVDVEVESAKNIEQEEVTEEIEEEHDEAMLFEDLPVSRGKIKPKKRDAVITVNALIGIGNKPYLRGDGAGLYSDKGTPMDYLEIGKWRYVLPEFDTPVNFTVLKNDITPPSGDTNFTIKSGEKAELNLIFPLEQELF